MLNYFWNYCLNVLLNFYIMDVIIDHVDPFKDFFIILNLNELIQ